ncbi:MAG: putative secreted protein with C-terminal beta-propeller domain [Gammaproteobacteria bacterium]|jgi:uncharacterized secreted protein with C-terminal beta-propeller domain
MIMMSPYKLGIFTLIGLSMLGCNPTEKEVIDPEYSLTPLSKVSLKQLSSCDEVTEYFASNLTETLLSGYRYYDGGPFFDDVIFATEAASDSVASAASGSAANPSSVSSTNLQVEGVDEADSVKTDSNGNIFIAHHEELLIYDGFPAEDLNQLASLKLEAQISGLYLLEDDHRIVALVSDYRNDEVSLSAKEFTASPPIDGFWNPGVSIIRVVTVDISNLEEPTIESDIEIEGWLVSSRLINGRLHLLTNYDLYRFAYQILDDDINKDLIDYGDYYSDQKSEEYLALREGIRNKVLNKLRGLNIDQFLPANVDHQTDNTLSRLSCDEIHAPSVDLSNVSLMTVSSLEIGSNEIAQSALLGNGWITYVTEKELFFVQNSNGWWWAPFQRQQTAIHHFSIGTTKPVYQSSTAVAGYINNAFSMSFHDNHLRVATSERFRQNMEGVTEEDANHLFVLKDNDSNGMDITGQVLSYAPGERIFSARFFNDKAFVVTFRQVDPLFGFNLSDPTNPRIVSELKIPGFSTYIHPLSENLLITIGEDGDEFGSNNDIAIKLFDVSDLSNMRLLDNFVPGPNSGYSWSAASWDHHSFNYHAEANMLVIPFSNYNYDQNSGFSGMLAMNIDTETPLVSELGRIDHRQLRSTQCSQSGDEFCQYDRDYNFWPSQPRRSVIMTDGSNRYLYAISSIGLSAVNTDNFDLTLSNDTFPQPDYNYYYWY